MTDRRATDHSLGHLGEATYDTVEKKWGFSRVPVLPSVIRPLNSLQPCIPPSAQPTPKPPRKDTDRTSNRHRDQRRSLVREFPVVGPAAALLGPLVRAADVEDSKTQPASGDLLAIGTAKVLGQSRTGRQINVLAIAHGEAGHVLRLIKPQVEEHTWASSDPAKLRILNPSISEDGYWLDGAGSIEQIAFSSDTEGNRAWLAVRKLAATTILQPLYHESPSPARVPRGFQDKYRPSCLDPNPALTVTSAMTGGRDHADVAFNPWYARQFAVLDEGGGWSAWDIEGRKNSGTKTASPGKSGSIDDDLESDASVDATSSGWGRILWAGSVSTIIVCNERHLAVFDLKSYPVRLHSPELVPNGTFGRIIEVKRSPKQLDKVFVLTNSRLFLLQISAAGEWHGDNEGAAGARIIMSCLHFRETQGHLLKLELHEEGDVCTAFLVSSAMFLVSVFRFTTTAEAATPVTWSTDSFYLKHGEGDETVAKMVGFCVNPAALERSDKAGKSRGEEGYLDHDKNFLQAFALGEGLEVLQTLLAECRMISAPSPGKSARYEQVLPPSESRAAPDEANFLSARTIDEFIVPDGFEDYESGEEQNVTILKPSIEDEIVKEPAPKLIDARRWYELATKGKAAEPSSQESYPDVELGMADYIQNIVGGIQHRRQAEQEGLSTFHDLAGFEKFTEDVDDGAALLQEFIDTFEDNYAGNSMALSLRSAGLLRLLDLEPDASSGDSLPNLSNVYDKLVDLWITTLPQNTPGMARIAKEKVVRNMAVDLCLSSLLVSIRDRSVPLPSSLPPPPEEGPSLTLPIHGGRPPPSPGRSQSRFSSTQPSLNHYSSFPPSSSIPTPTPSDFTPLAGEPIEDPSVSRLRAYTPIKSLKPLGPIRASILAQWPETPGSDPATYVWRPEAIAGAVEAGDSSEEEATRRAEEKRRRRTERFLRRQSQKGAESPGGVRMVLSSQAPPTPRVGLGSQLAAPRMVLSSQPGVVDSPARFRGVVAESQGVSVGVPGSSQVDGGMPMTQPSAGVFGSRKGLGKKKKRKTGF